MALLAVTELSFWELLKVEQEDGQEEKLLPISKLPDAQLNLARDFKHQLKLLRRAMQPRDEGGIVREKGISFGDLVIEPMTVDRCETFIAELDSVGSSCSPAANYVRTILRNWNLALGKPAAGLSGDALYWLFEEPDRTSLSKAEQHVKDQEVVGKRRISKWAVAAAVPVIFVAAGFAQGYYKVHGRKPLQQQLSLSRSNIEAKAGRSRGADWGHDSC